MTPNSMLKFRSLLDLATSTTPTRRTLVKGGAGAAAAGALGLRFSGLAGAQQPPSGGQGQGGNGGGGPEGGGQGGQSDTLDEFVGVTTDGNVIDGLYEVSATGESTAAVREAATAFLDTLTEDQRAATLFAVDDDEWRKWSNIDGYQRQGTSIREMSEDQRSAAFALLEASLSASGYELAVNIMKLNHTEGELMDDLESFDEDLYWFTIMGEPSETDPWGWQLDGHHLVINYFLLGDQVVMAPVFLGSEPTIAPEGTDYAGISVLLENQAAGLALIQSLDADQLASAVLSSDKGGENLQAGASSDNAVVGYAGINATALTADQQELLWAVVEQFVGNMDTPHAEIKMDEVRAHVDDTWFAWIGATTDDAVFYYRVQSPVVLVEFDHQSPGPLGQRSDYYGGASGPQQMHIHSMLRTPNGNDYGKDLLAQHYATASHHQATTTMAMPVAGAVAAGGYMAWKHLLPPRYLGGAPVSAAPMGAAELVFNADGSVAWGEIWGDFCDLALAGGPSHRGTLLEPASPEAVRADPAGYETALTEIERGLRMVTGWEVRRDLAPGWIGLDCPNEEAAIWLMRAILVENVCVRREGATLCLPVGPDYTLKGEIKNVVTVVAKTHHYWTEHIAMMIA